MCCTFTHIGPGARKATLLMMRLPSLLHVTSVVRNTRWPSFDHSAVSVPLQSVSTIDRAAPSAITSSSMPRCVPTSVCNRTPVRSGVMHIRAPVPAISSSSRQHPSQPLKRASIFCAGDGAVCASVLATGPARRAALANVRTAIRFVMIVSALKHEIDARAETEAAQIHRLEVDEILIELRINRRVAALEREVEPLEYEDVRATKRVHRRRPALRLKDVGKDPERPGRPVLGGEVHEIAGLPEGVARHAAARTHVRHDGA